MKKLFLAALIILLSSGAAATTVVNEDVEVDLETSEVTVDLQVEDLTPSVFTYFTTYGISDVEVTSNGQPVNCTVEPSSIQSQISCEPPNEDDFNLSISYDASNLVTAEDENTRAFQYTQNFIRPTDNYSLTVVLPEGVGVINDDEISASAINPENGDIGSDGRRITVEWNQDPSLGDRTDFHVFYENLSPRINYIQAAVLIIALIALTGLSYVGYRRISREDIENTYDSLTDDEVETVEILREEDGEILQKDLVDRLGYSKAKVSGIVSGLVEKEIISKSKEGRSNKLSISKRYH